MSKLTKEERAFKRQFNEAALDEDEFAESAAEVPGPLGDAAKALLEAKRNFNDQLERIGVEVG